MQPFAFCNRCRGMKVSWNRRYILHCLICLEWLAKSTKILALTALLSSFVFAFPVSTGLPPVPEAAARQSVDEPANTARDIEQAKSLEKMLAPYGCQSRASGPGCSRDHGQQQEVQGGPAADREYRDRREWNESVCRVGRGFRRNHADSPRNLGGDRRQGERQPLQN